MADSVLMEIRTYRLRPGTDEEFNRLVTRRCVPLLAEFGIRVLRAGPSEATEDGARDYVLVRTFDSLGVREEQESRFYGSAQWRDGPRAEMLAMIESYHTVVLTVPAPAVESWTPA